jgi:hypothetical protein
MRRAAEDRAGAVIHQDEIGDPDRQFPAGSKRVAHPSPVSNSPASRPFRWPPRWCRPCGIRRRRRRSRVRRLQRLGQRMIGRDADEGRAHQRVGPGGVDPRSGRARHRLRQAERRIADPRDLPIQLACISLHLRGPVVQPVERLQQLLGKSEILKNHCVSSRRSTSAPERQPLPSITCSLASTVMSTGSQFTTAFLR